MQKKLILIIGLLCLCLKAAAQNDASFGQYWNVMPYYNPATVGKQSKVNVAVAYQMNLVGFENNPRTMYIAADLPFYFLRSYHGAGVEVLNDQIGLFKNQRIALQYAFRLKLFGGMLGVGAMAGMISEAFDGSKLDLNEKSDPAFATSEVEGHALDLALGLYYQHKNWYAGFATQHLTQPLIRLGETNELEMARAYNLLGGCNIKLRNTFLSIQPSVLAQTDLATYKVDVTARLVYSHDDKRLEAGVSYSFKNSVTFIIGGLFHGISLGYSYEAYTSALKFGPGSHGIVVGYQTDINLQKKGRNRHKSVRLL